VEFLQFCTLRGVGMREIVLDAVNAEGLTEAFNDPSI
jgi:hypothetical protein